MFTPLLSPQSFFPTNTQYPAVNNPSAAVDSTGRSGILPKSHLDLFLPESKPIDLQVRVYPEWFKEATVSWTIPDIWLSKNPRFNIYRSEVEGSGYLKLNTVPVFSSFYVDESTRESSKHSKEFYIIEAILDDDTIWKTKPAWVGDRLPRWHHIRLKEINRREWILLRRYVGNEAILLRHMRYGPRCSNCYDTISKKIIKPSCPVCYGTSYEGGYYAGIRTYAQFDASIDSSVHTYFGKFEQNEIAAWTIQYPDVEVFDLIIRIKDYKVYKVKQNQNTEILNKMCRQIMRLEELPPSDVSYELIKREGLLNV